MLIRIRETFVIIFITFLIILFSVLAGISYVQNSIKKSQEADLLLLSDIADRFISTDIELLKLKVAGIAHNLSMYGEEEWPERMAVQGEPHPEFIGMAVLNDEGSFLVSSGFLPSPEKLMDELFIKRAFQGKIFISSTIPSVQGDVVFCLAAPMPSARDKILIVTLKRMFFAELISTFVIWENGHIFIDDAEGNILANTLNREAWVQNRHNFVRLAQNDKQFESIASVIRRGVNRETGVGYFTINGIDNVCAFRPVSGSEEGWFLGVVGHLPESPFRNIDMGLIVVGIVCFFLSITAAITAAVVIRRSFREMALLKEMAESNSRAKSVFLANMSHEMRTPMNVIVGLTDLLLEEDKPVNIKETLGKINTAGTSLMGLINDVLDISKVEAGRMELMPVQYDVASLLNDIITLNMIRIEEKPIAFKLDIDDNTPSGLFGDDLRIKQILNNLLSNAFKYTKEGTVTLGVKCRPEEVLEGARPGDPAAPQSSVWVSFYVSDTGIGIRQEDINKLFSDFNQVDARANRTIEGTGLGLSITKKFIELMGGEISFESEYGKGTTFRVRIRQGFVTDKPISEETLENLRTFRYLEKKKRTNEKLVRSDLSYARVLVVDDFQTNLDVAVGMLRKYKIQVDCVTNAQESIRLIAAGTPVYDAVFMDHMMPGMDGIEATKIIRAIGTKYAENIPVIAMTANVVAGNEQMFLDNGFNAFLPKPFNVMLLDSIVQRWVRDKSRE
jgi:signal transduction histidine kinase/CheY-like chemotaxis protein